MMLLEHILNPREKNGHRSGVGDLHLNHLLRVGSDQSDLDHPEWIWKQYFREKVNKGTTELNLNTMVIINLGV